MDAQSPPNEKVVLYCNRCDEKVMVIDLGKIDTIKGLHRESQSSGTIPCPFTTGNPGSTQCTLQKGKDCGNCGRTT